MRGFVIRLDDITTSPSPSTPIAVGSGCKIWIGCLASMGNVDEIDCKCKEPALPTWNSFRYILVLAVPQGTSTVLSDVMRQSMWPSLDNRIRPATSRSEAD